MSTPSIPPLDPDTQAMLECLQQAVAKALERKRRLGHYAVFWDGKAIIAEGEDAPADMDAESFTKE
jgi:hypothetical protein